MTANYGFGFSDVVIAEAGGTTTGRMHFDAEVLVEAFKKFEPIAQRLGVPAPKPRMMGFGYPHIASLGAEISFPVDGEPKPSPVIKSYREIDSLHEPEDYLAAPLIQRKLAVLQDLKDLCPDVPDFIGHAWEGPVTTAVLLMGSDFFTLVYDDPARAHRLLDFCTESAVNYAAALSSYFGAKSVPETVSIPDDFAGMLPPALFAEFVLPYWDKLYTGSKATDRRLHSELLREEHLSLLEKINIKMFDPSADQYLSPEVLSRKCPCDFILRIMTWDIHNNSEEQLEKLYAELQSHNPAAVCFAMSFLAEEAKIKRLLLTAKEMQDAE